MSDWPTTRAQIIDAFDGELPGATLEAQLVDLYHAHPAAVLDSYPSIATSKAAGKINSGWAILRKAAAEKATRQDNPTVNREKRIRNADQWLRNAGLHFDRWHEVHDHLFGDQGTIRDLKSDKLERRYLEAWTTVRVDGVLTEEAELERATRYIANRKALADMAQRKHEHDLDEAA